MWESLVIGLYLKYKVHVTHCLILGEFPSSGLQSEPCDKVAVPSPFPEGQPADESGAFTSLALRSQLLRIRFLRC